MTTVTSAVVPGALAALLLGSAAFSFTLPSRAARPTARAAALLSQ